MFIDTHCHLNELDMERELPLLREAHISKLITIGYDVESSAQAIDLSERYAEVFAAVGFHPTELHKGKEGDLALIEEMAKSEKAVAVGEIGLDYHYDDTDKPLQREWFVAQLELAKSLKLPVSIHSRDCAEDMLRLLKENRDKLVCGGVMHCYSHSVEMMKDFLDLGLFLGFGGTVTYKNAKKTVECARLVPADRFLTETDAPYLPPVPHRGERNSPVYIPLIAAKLAEVRGETIERMKEQVRANTKALFGI